MTTPEQSNPGTRAGVFATPNWSVVLLVGQGHASEAGCALTQHSEAYWYPLYAFVRRSGHAPEDAQDLTQEFFARLLEKNWLAEVDAELRHLREIFGGNERATFRFPKVFSLLQRLLPDVAVPHLT